MLNFHYQRHYNLVKFMYLDSSLWFLLKVQALKIRHISLPDHGAVLTSLL